MKRRFLYKYYTHQGDDIGKPLITTLNGQIISYTSTESMEFNGSNNVNTGILLTYTPNRSDTILNCMNEGDNTYPGFCIRWSSSSYLKLYYGDESANSGSDSQLTFDITLIKPANSNSVSLTETTSGNSGTYQMTFDNSVSLVVGGSINASGDGQRYATCTITDFL
jgi:hypothetical protein